MNKKGDEPLKNTTISGIILVVTLVIIFTGCTLKKELFNPQCPAGFEKIKDFSDREISNYCNREGDLKEKGLSCCQRKTNQDDVCLWDVKNKEQVGYCMGVEINPFIECEKLCNEAKDVFTFNEMYKSEFCSDNKFSVTLEDGTSILKICPEIYTSCWSCRRPSGGIPSE